MPEGTESWVVEKIKIKHFPPWEKEKKAAKKPHWGTKLNERKSGYLYMVREKEKERER